MSVKALTDPEVERQVREWEDLALHNTSQFQLYANESGNTSFVQFYMEPGFRKTYWMASTAVYLCTHLGLLSVILNLFVFIALIRNRRRVLSNVFYVIVLHCALLDIVRGMCLIAYGLPSLAASLYHMFSWRLEISTNVTLFRASSFALVILRICNLLTIFNLLVFTTNEFVVIRYPLHYRRYIRRRAVLAVLGSCWIVSIVMGLGLLFPPSHRHLASGEQTWTIDVATLSMLLISALCYLVLGVVVICYAFILRTIRKFKEDNGSLNTEESHRHNRSATTLNGRNSTGSTGGSRTKRFRMQALQRHKYVYVIGTVLLVDLLFLCPYSGIQIVSFLHINHFLEISYEATLLRWWLQVLIGVHSVCQPLCYFRMTEFRRLACCGGKKSWPRSKSYSQLNKSFANTRSAAREDEEDKMGQPEDPLLKEGRSTPNPSERSLQHTWVRGESTRFRTYPNEVPNQVILTTEACEVAGDMEMHPISNGNGVAPSDH